jgi:peptidoglycan/xylan/chitin deacetylase (PgdA/CDA1 family)
VSRPRSIEPTVVLTFDNLGEASDMERGTWAPNGPVGQHPSVTQALPRLLAELFDLGLRATFFIEAINCELNPEAVRSIAQRGHEIGIHGWRHESWEGIEPERERALLQRSRAAYRQIGVDTRTFRPPGGAINAETPGLLREIGCRWASPYGTAPHVDDDGFGWVPFDWALVDAYYLMPRFATLRERRGDPAAPRSTATAAGRLRTHLERGPEPRTLILHPFLLADDEWWSEARQLLRMLANRREQGQISLATGGELTEKLSGQR